MSVTKQEVISTAKLARLKFSDSEIDSLADSMNKIVAMFDQLSQVCTDKVQHLDILPCQRLEDFPEQNPQESTDKSGNFNSFAIEFENGEFLAPKVIDEGE